jgi:hypothetical protein
MNFIIVSTFQQANLKMFAWHVNAYMYRTRTKIKCYLNIDASRIIVIVNPFEIKFT